MQNAECRQNERAAWSQVDAPAFCILNSECPVLVNDLATARAPREAVARPSQADHQHAVFAADARRPCRDDDLIADLQRFARDAGVGQLGGPAHSTAQRCIAPASSGACTVHERMRVAIGELDQLAFELDLLLRVVGRAVRMVREGRRAGKLSAPRTSIT